MSRCSRSAAWQHTARRQGATFVEGGRGREALISRIVRLVALVDGLHIFASRRCSERPSICVKSRRAGAMTVLQQEQMGEDL